MTKCAGATRFATRTALGRSIDVVASPVLDGMPHHSPEGKS